MSLRVQEDRPSTRRRSTPNPLPLVILILLTLMLADRQIAANEPSRDPRNIQHGRVIPDEGYCDQPYVVVRPDGGWVCTLTTGSGSEGEAGQHVAATISLDRGMTWSPLIAIEPSDGPAASWAMPLITPDGRIYVFYTYNRDRVTEVPSNNAYARRRVDTLGTYAYRYSDDGGHTWSDRRFEIPMRLMEIDRTNPFAGQTLLFWGVGKPIIDRDTVFFGFSKVGKWGAPGTLVTSRGCVMVSPNLLSEPDPVRHTWHLFPEGDSGLRAPKGPIAEEANLVALENGSLYATYRTIDGYPCAVQSRDRGRTWSEPAYMARRPGGKPFKNPRAANFIRKLSNGKYLYWFHNHGGEAVHRPGWNPYDDRNPAWLSGGVERDGTIHWSEPEIVLYDPDPSVRISYPDFIEDGGRVYITETQKTVARVHPIDRTLLEGLWGQLEDEVTPVSEPIWEWSGQDPVPEWPELPSLVEGEGFTIEAWVRFDELTAGQVVLDTRDEAGRGIRLATTDRSTLGLTLADGEVESTWDSDPGTHPGTIVVGRWQHVVAIVEGGPRLILFVVDGHLNDGGAVRQFGWGRIPDTLTSVNGQWIRIDQPGDGLFGNLHRLRLYDRPLHVSEAVSLSRTDRPVND